MPFPKQSSFGCWSTYLLVCVLLLTACSTSSQPSGASATPEHSQAPATATATASIPQRCQPPSPIQTISGATMKGILEAQGQASNAELWTLLPGPMPLPVGKDEKYVWKMTGSGAFQVIALNPNGMRISPIWGPEAHLGGSSWTQHPGDEWGVGFNLPRAGCWDLHVIRGISVGDVWITTQ